MLHPLLTHTLGARRDALMPRARGEVLDVTAAMLAPGTPVVRRYDTVVCCGALCGVEDIDAALRRVDELLAPGGQVLVVEHVWVPGVRGRIQRAAAPAVNRMPKGCRVDRDVIAALRRNGFAVTDCDRRRARVPIVGPHVSAVAIRAATDQRGEDE